MKANKCDICVALYERKYTPDVRINVYIHPYGEEWLDLCPKCQEKLEKFVSTSWQGKAVNKRIKLEGKPE
jgi:hypothetical protein